MAPGTSSVPAEMLSLRKTFEDAKLAHASYRSSIAGTTSEAGGASTAKLQLACKLYRSFLDDAVGMGRRHWTQYNTPQMELGLFTQFCVVLCLIVRYRAFSGDAAKYKERETDESVTTNVLSNYMKAEWRVACRGLLVGCVVASSLGFSLPVRFANSTSAFAVIAAASALALASHWAHFVLIEHKHRSSVSRRWTLWSTFIPYVIVVLYSVGVFSNSFIEKEDVMHLFLGGSALLGVGGVAWERRACNRTVILAVASAICFRIASAIGVGSGALHTVRVGTSAIDGAAVLALVCAVAPLLVILAIVNMLGGGNNVHRSLYAIAMISTGSYWLCQTVAGGSSPSWLNMLPRLTYFSSSVGVLYSLWQPCPSHTTSKDDHKIEGQEPSPKLTSLPGAVTGHIITSTVLLLGPSSSATVCLLLMSASLLKAGLNLMPGQPPTLLLSVVWTIGSRAAFFFTGHHSQFSRLQYSAAFIGFETFHPLVGGILLFINTFGLEVSLLVSLPLLCGGRSSSDMNRSLGGVTYLDQVALAVSTLSCVRTCLSMLNAYIQRRHLMLWAVFAPKFVFDAVMQAVLSTAVVVMWALVCRERAALSKHQRPMRIE